MPAMPQFVKAWGRLVLAGTAVPWSPSAWKMVGVAEAAVGADATLDALSVTLPGQACAAWPIQPFVPYDEGPPEVFEVLPSVTTSAPLQWTNSSAEPVTVGAFVVYAMNPTTGKNEILFWQPLASPLTIPPGDTATLTQFRFTLQEVLDG
jgi:hypothetical protein